MASMSRAVKIFADHHPLSQREIEALLFEARRDALTLVTTEKDLARLRGPAGIAGLGAGDRPVCRDAAMRRPGGVAEVCDRRSVSSAAKKALTDCS